MMAFLPKTTVAAIGIAIYLVACPAGIIAQNLPIEQQKFIFFPHPMSHKWATSIGLTATTMPYDITEEMHYRVPAGDFHVLRKISNKINLDGRISFQVLQNLFTIGPRWTTELNDRISVG